MKMEIPLKLMYLTCSLMMNPYLCVQDDV